MILTVVCLSGLFYMVNCFSGWVDPDVPENAKTTKSFVDKLAVYEIIMADEFNRDGRTFKDGEDPMWTAIENADNSRGSGVQNLEYYNNSLVYTKNGSLVIETIPGLTKWRGYDPFAKKYTIFETRFRSGMLQSWNKFCYTGGIFEVRVKFPGFSSVGGLWPAVWLLGNLGRATYESSTNLVWPWSFPECDRNLQKAQTISGCDESVHYNLNPHQGRGSTEIDVIEVMAGESGQLPVVPPNIQRPYVSMTLQVF